MKNPFKKKKAHRTLGYSPTKAELQEEFDKLLKHRVAMRFKSELGENKSPMDFMEFREKNGDRIMDEENAKLVAELKEKGYSRVHELTRQPGQDVVLKKIIGGRHE
jgi:ribosomal protein L29